MTMPTNMRQHAQELIEQIPGSSLPQVVAILEELCRNVDPPPQTLPDQPPEQALLYKLQQKLTPQEQTRLAYLRQQDESGVITEPEHQELLAYVDRIEQQDAERVEAQIQLAQIRKFDPKSLMAQYLPVTNAV